MALDLEIIVRERETGRITERVTRLSLTPRELGNVHRLEEAIIDGVDLEFVSGDW